MSYSSEAVNAAAEGVSSASAVTRSSAGFKAPGQTAFTWTGKINPVTGGTTTIFLGTLASLNPSTGLAAKVYLTDVQLVTDFANASGNLDIQVQAGGINLIRTSIHNLAPADFINMETQPNANAGSSLQLVIGSAATTTNLWYFVSGWTE